MWRILFLFMNCQKRPFKKNMKYCEAVDLIYDKKAS